MDTVREPSASNLGLAALCGHPFTSGIEWPEDADKHSLLGKRIHRGCESLVTREMVFPAILVGLSETERFSLFGCVDRAREYLGSRVRPSMSWEQAELHLRYQVESGRVRRSTRDERRLAGEWSATLDHVSDLPGGGIRVIDYKSGRQENAVAVADNWQMKLQAAAAARFFGASDVRVELVYLDKHEWAADVGEFGPLDLMLIAEELRDIRAGLRNGPTPPVPGAHCTEKYCPLKGICGATQSALASVQPMERPLSLVIRNDEEARFAYERIPGAYAALKAIENVVDEYARHHPFDLSNGKVYGWRQRTERDVIADTPEQRIALQAVLGEHAEGVVRIKHEASIGRIEDAARALVAALPDGQKKPTIKAVTNRALAALEAAGGVKVSTFYRPEAFKRRAEEQEQ
jgi:hypothetical protein